MTRKRVLFAITVAGLIASIATYVTTPKIVWWTFQGATVKRPCSFVQDWTRRDEMCVADIPSALARSGGVIVLTALVFAAASVATKPGGNGTA